MKKAFLLATLALGFCSTLFPSKVQASQITTETLKRMPLVFAKNMGQWDERVLFRADAGGATMWFTKEGVTYQFIRRIERNGDPLSILDSRLPGKDTEPDSIEQLVISAKFVDANPNPEVVGEGLMEYRCNYFIGNDPTKWHTDVPNYEAITLKDIYPGIDLKFSGDGDSQAAYHFVVAPGTDIAQIKVEYEGAEETIVDADGRVIVRTKWGYMIAAIKAPTNGAMSGTGSFSQLSEETIGLETGGSSRQALGTLSVGLVYSTYLGGGGDDRGYGIAVDNSGNAYVTGYTSSSDYPTQNPYQAYQGEVDVFVTKLSSSGNSRVYSTYLGGEYQDIGRGIAVDGSGNAYVTGNTRSNYFPTENPFQVHQGEDDAFVTKLSSSGNSLVYSTYLGGNSDFGDYGYGIAVDASGNAYVTGRTGSSNFPTQNPYQSALGDTWDAFVTKLSETGNSLIYSTYLGGGDGVYGDRGYGIAVDGSGNAYVTGWTSSSDFPTVNPYQTHQGGPEDTNADVFVTKLSSSGNSLIYSTYLGGGDYDWGYCIAVNGTGNAYVTGETMSSDFPTMNPFQATYQGNHDAFVTKLSSVGNDLIYCTYLGGEGEDVGQGIAVNGSGNAYVTGWTSSSDFPNHNPFQTNQDGADAFVTKLSSSGTSPIYSTYLGGSGDEGQDVYAPPIDIAVDGSGNAYVTGWTWSSNFPTLSPCQPYQGGSDAFVTKLGEVENCSDMLFRPDPNGWQFKNEITRMWPQSWWQQFDYSQPQYPFLWRYQCSASDFPDWPLFVSAFGESQCYYDPPPGVVIFKPSAKLMWFSIKGNWHGSCFGFAVSSFLFFDEYLDVTTEYPGNTEVYHVPIGDQSRLMLNKYFVCQLGKTQQEHINTNYNTTTPNQTLQACQEMFKSTTHNDRVLLLFNNNGSGAHAVNPYRCEIDPANPDITYVYVYDNSLPGNDSMRVFINTVTNTWSYDGQTGWGGTKRLFLSDPMSNYTTNPLMSRSPTLRDRWISKAEHSVSQYAEFYLPSTGDALFRFSSDSIGYVDGSLFSNLADGMPIIPITGQDTPPIGYYLPNRPWSIQLSGFPESRLTLTAYLDSTVIAYSRNGVDSMQTDELKYGGNDSSFVVVNPDIVSHVYDLQVISIHPDSEVVVKIGGITSDAGDSIHFSITSESGLRIDNYGASSAYSIRVEIAGSTFDTAFFHHSVTIGGNSSHVIVPDWRLNHDSLFVLVDSGMIGSFSDSLVIPNQGEVLFVCGDADSKGTVNITDAVYLINYIFAYGPAPDPMDSGDVDCSGRIDISDVVFLINYIFAGGAEPCSACK